jgi:phosphoribosylanthranilate isomerase
MHIPYVKICGLTNLADARVAIEAGADLLGFIFYPKSPRYVTPDTVAEIVRELRDWRLEISRGAIDLESPISKPQSPIPKFVGVFVNESPARISEILTFAQLDYAQLHGNETPAMLTQLAGRAFKVLRPTSAEEAVADANQFAPLGTFDGPRLLIEAYDPNLYGGTGKTADWHVSATLARRHPGLLLAGSLTTENIAAAIQTVQPWGVDVSSGVEAVPGRKDHAKVRAFVQAAKHQIE